MKKICAISFAFILIYSVSHAQKSTFLRLYNLSGHKFQKGHFAGTTDSSLYVYRDSSRIEIPISTIGYIKTKRSLGHNILFSAIPGAIAFAIFGYATGEPNETTDNNITLGGVVHDMVTPTPAEGLQGGLIIGSVLGTAAGSLITVLSKRTTFRIDGSLDTWKSQKELIDLLPAGK
jgi:hypothetical protein